MISLLIFQYAAYHLLTLITVPFLIVLFFSYCGLLLFFILFSNFPYFFDRYVGFEESSIVFPRV